MEVEKTIRVTFGPDESDFYDVLQKRCADDGTNVSDYVKGVIKKDLAWGHLARRKKTNRT